MNIEKLTKIMLVTGLVIIVGGILTGAVLGMVMGNGGFNLVVSITIWLLSLVGGTGFVTVSGSISDAKEKKKKNEEMLQMILESMKNN